MRYFLSAILGALLGFSAQADTLTAAEAAKLLAPSIGVMQDRGSHICTLTKIGAREWLTAKHCVARLSNDYRADTLNSGYVYMRSVQIALSEKADGQREEDWAILQASSDTPSTPALELGCGEKLYLGMPVAYMGFPADVTRAFSVGYVAGLNKVDNNGWSGHDFQVDIQAAPGASGSAIISLESGHIIGVLTEGVPNNMGGYFLVGVESIENTDTCEDWSNRMDYWNKFSDDEEPMIIIDDPDIEGAKKIPVRGSIIDVT